MTGVYILIRLVLDFNKIFIIFYKSFFNFKTITGKLIFTSEIFSLKKIPIKKE
jgi:hypothetical protein